MRVARNDISLKTGLKQAAVEAEKAFNNAGVYLEKYIETPRHIEFQIVADSKGRVACFEIMISTPSIQALIRDNKTYRITSDIQTGAKYGMITIDAHLMALYQAGKIGYEDLITKAQDPESIVMKLEETQHKKR